MALLIARVSPAGAGCYASGTVTGTDSAADCAALLAAYTAWGNQPTSWAAGIAAGASYCSWDTNSLTCSSGRVLTLCAPSPQASYPRERAAEQPAPRACWELTTRSVLARRSAGRLGLTGSIPSELGNLTSLQTLCAPPTPAHARGKRCGAACCALLPLSESFTISTYYSACVRTDVSRIRSALCTHALQKPPGEHAHRNHPGDAGQSCEPD